MTLVYTLLKCGISDDSLGLEDGQLPFLALKPSIMDDLFMRHSILDGIHLPLDYSGFDNSVTIRMILIIL